MEDKKDKIQENVRAQLGGMDLYGTTSNEEVAGYRASGDIENAGQLDRGFKKNRAVKVKLHLSLLNSKGKMSYTGFLIVL
jgi:hypothetical protein